MAHLRTVIRQRIETVLGAISGLTIEASRVRPWQREQLPAVSVSTRRETVVPDDKGSVALRTLDVDVVIADQAGRSSDDVLDGLCLDVEAAIEADWQSLDEGALGALLFDLQLDETEITLEGEGERETGAATLSYSARYLATAGNPSR